MYKKKLQPYLHSLQYNFFFGCKIRQKKLPKGFSCDRTSEREKFSVCIGRRQYAVFFLKYCIWFKKCDNKFCVCNGGGTILFSHFQFKTGLCQKKNLIISRVLRNTKIKNVYRNKFGFSESLYYICTVEWAKWVMENDCVGRMKKI